MGKEGKKEMNHGSFKRGDFLKIKLLFLCNINSCKMVYNHLLAAPGVSFKEAKSFSLRKVTVCVGLWINDRSGAICAPKGPPLMSEENQVLKD